MDGLDSVRGALHCLRIGHLQIPVGVDVGDFIVSGGRLTASEVAETPKIPLSNAIKEYSESQKNKVADSYLECQRIHLGHLKRFLGNTDELECQAITSKDLQRFLNERLQIRDPNTVTRERSTLIRFFEWVHNQGYVDASPAANLESITAGRDLPPFRTVAEIEAIVERGGIDDDGIRDLWECLYLSPADIADLLNTVRKNATYNASLLLHAIPAYTGMRRGEVLRLRWTDVDLDQGFVTARSRKQSRTKRETSRRIDLHPDLRCKLDSWYAKRPSGQYIISDTDTLEPINKDKANRCFWQPMRGTKWCLESRKNHFKVGFHTYRHSFASNLAASGVDQRIIDEFMGHTTEAMRKRYRHLFPNNRRAAIETLSYSTSRDSQ